MNHRTPGTIALIVVNVAIFAATVATTQTTAGSPLDLLALHYPQNADFRPWQFLTHMFMHGSLGHLFFNMFGLFMFGGTLEKLWGARRYLVFYFVTGIGAGLVYTGVNIYEFRAGLQALEENRVSIVAVQRFLESTPPDRLILPAWSAEQHVDFWRAFNGSVVGASGAIYGILVAFAIRFPNAKLALLFLPFPIAAKYFVPALLLMDLFSGVTGISLFGGGIAHFAHIGGAVIGFLLMLYWRKGAREQRPDEAF